MPKLTEAQKTEREMTRLKGLVEWAYEEGYRNAAMEGYWEPPTDANVAEAWDASQAKKSLTPTRNDR